MLPWIIINIDLKRSNPAATVIKRRAGVKFNARSSYEMIWNAICWR
jgi:hypothetical protein